MWDSNTQLLLTPHVSITLSEQTGQSSTVAGQSGGADGISRAGLVLTLGGVCLGGYLGGRMGGSSLIQQQQRHSLVVVVSSYMQGGQAALQQAPRAPTRKHATQQQVRRRVGWSMKTLMTTLDVLQHDSRDSRTFYPALSHVSVPRIHPFKSSLTFPAASGAALLCRRRLATSILPYFAATCRGLKPFCYRMK